MSQSDDPLRRTLDRLGVAHGTRVRLGFTPDIALLNYSSVTVKAQKRDAAKRLLATVAKMGLRPPLDNRALAIDQRCRKALGHRSLLTEDASHVISGRLRRAERMRLKKRVLGIESGDSGDVMILHARCQISPQCRAASRVFIYPP